jgi:hypothetical protein
VLDGALQRLLRAMEIENALADAIELQASPAIVSCRIFCE